MIQQDDNFKREMMLHIIKNAMVLNGGNHRVPADITLSAVHEIECALQYECKSTHGLTDE